MKTLVTIIAILITAKANSQIWITKISGSEGIYLNTLCKYNDSLLYLANNITGPGLTYRLTDGTNESMVIALDSGWDEGRFPPDYSYQNPMAIDGTDIYYTGYSFPARYGFVVTSLYKLDRNSKLPIRIDPIIDPLASKYYSSPRFMHIMNGSLYVVMITNTGSAVFELWEYSIANNTFRQISNLSSPNNRNTYISDVINYRGRLIYNLTHTLDFARSIIEYIPATGANDTLPVATEIIHDAKAFTIHGHNLYFIALPGAHSEINQLCMYDGKNPIEVLTSFSGGRLEDNRQIIGVGNKIYFAYTESKGRVLWSYDIETKIAGPVEPLQNLQLAYGPFAAYNNKLYFPVTTKDSKTALYNFDGNTAELVDAEHQGFQDFLVFKGKLYFTGPDEEGRPALFSLTDEDTPPDLPEPILYPNPTTGTATFAFSTSTTQFFALIITDQGGKRVFHKPLANYPAGINKINIDAGCFASGIYYCRLTNKSGTVVWTKKLVKE